MPRYENGKRDVLLEALECATRDREGMRQSIASGVHGFWQLPREEALAKLSPDDRRYFLECESYMRDFEKMEAVVQGQPG
ncbi:hypothetical protein [Pseudomonas costantinii]|uniref:Uncharacterized protein n=1 Tax=Pseudomonas costantinii TaxID=168469 RepID=A0A1H4U612_9PSED|nr:hypothetical protein [Pseudomonas costantinii]SEC62153.1 hypothetical protein SAMN04515675_0012 [Pseudomonas costantinii]SEC63878.1 hypothetical protein SAMN04515675_0067 [Pseudomonas costantinii]